MLPITQDLITVNFTRRTNRKIEWIVIHYFGALGDDVAVVDYFDRDATNASAHYALDDDSITQAVLDENTAWHCGDSGKGAFKGLCTNANSIGIEVRPYKVNSAHVSAVDSDWYFHEQTIDNLRELVRYLMAKHGIDADHVIRHYDVTAKWCPRPWMGDDINTYYGKTGNQLWADFKTSLTATESEDEIKMTKEELMSVAGTGDEPSAWAKEATEKMKELGVFNGDGQGNFGWQQPITREAVAVVLANFAEKMGL